MRGYLMKPYFHTPNTSSFLFLAWLVISFTCIEQLFVGSANAKEDPTAPANIEPKATLPPIKPASPETLEKNAKWNSPEVAAERNRKNEEAIAKQVEEDKKAAAALAEATAAANKASSNQASSNSGQGSGKRDPDFEVKEDKSFIPFVGPVGNGDNPPPAFIPFVGPVGNGDNPPPAPIRTAVKLQLQDIASFSCSESEPATAAKTKSSNNAPVILWKSAIFKDYSPKTRCAHVSTRFEAYRKILVEGKTPLFITSGKLNKNPVICLTTTQEKEGCEEGKLPHNGLLFTLAPFQESTATKLVENLGTLLADLRQGKTVQPLES